MVFLWFFGLFQVIYVNWAERHAVPIAEMHLRTQSGYTVKIDSVAVLLSSLVFVGIRISEKGETIGEVDRLTLHEPSLLSLLLRGELTARRVKVGTIRTTRDDVRQFFEERASFSPNPP